MPKPRHFTPSVQHSSHSAELRSAKRVLWVALALLAVLLLVPADGWVVPGFLWLHMLLETLAISVAAMLFATVWSTRKESLPCNLSLVAIGMLGVGILDFSHMLSYRGMPDFFTPSGEEKAINFWLAARLLGALMLLALAFSSWRRRLQRVRALVALWLILLLVMLVHGVFLVYPHWMPATYIEGVGLTPFKTFSEYLLIVLLLVAALRFALALRAPREFHASGFMAAAILLAISEYCFTLCGDVTDFYNLTGHLYKLAGFGFLYRAAFVETVQRPYELLHQSRAQLDLTLSAMPDLLFEMDRQGRYLQVFTPDSSRLSAPAELLLGRRVEEVMPATAAATMLQALDEASTQGHSWGRVIELTQQDGQPSWFEVSVARHEKVNEGQEPGFLVVSRDVTARFQAEQAQNALWQMVEQNPLAVLVLDKKLHIEHVNKAFTHMSGYALDEVRGRHPAFLHGPCLETTGGVEELDRMLLAGHSWSGELICVRRNGEEYFEQVRVFPVKDPQGQIERYLAIKEDITESRAFAERLEQLSNHDPLTGLPNRDLLEREFARLRIEHMRLALIWLNLDNFKEINEAMGHAAGDLLLKQIAYRLRDQLHEQEVLARLSGDDFVLLLPSDNQANTAWRVRELLDLIAEPLVLPRQSLSMTASAGIATLPEDATSFGDLLRMAELGKHRAKTAGRNGYQFYRADMQEQATLRLAQSHALKQALARQELYLVYQPQVSLAGRRVVGVEALLRWRSSEWGEVSPATFIPLAESNGMILPIGEWVLHQALQQLRSWLDQGLAPISMAVNISAIQFEQPDFPALVSQVLEQSGVPAQLLDLELTEALAMKNPQLSAERIRELRARQVRFSIDDFGTGYSSLSYLKQFKIHKLKIDREFIRQVDADLDDQAITAAVIRMAQQLGITSLAEGVETAAQLELLQRFGCDQVQGYFFSKPLPAEQVMEFVRGGGSF